MGNEAQKNQDRRMYNAEYKALFQGEGIDIGCGHWPVTNDCMTWDKVNGDATHMKGMKDEQFDWVHSSHCLEHLHDPKLALKNWWRLVKPYGYLIVTVPCFFLYEKKNWPSRFNTDHKQKFTILPQPGTIPVLSLYTDLKGCQVRWVRTNDNKFSYSDKISDQTGGAAQAEIEIVTQKIDTFWTEV